jgi:hypothetical protein
MLNLVLALTILISLFILLSLSVLAGRVYGNHELRKYGKDQLEVVTVAEGAVFTLLALLVAFAFSGAYDRFEHRKLHTIEEANIFKTAYERIDLLAPDTQPTLRASYREYLDTQVETYRTAEQFRLFKYQVEKSVSIEEKIWQQAVAACKTTNDPSGAVTHLFLPAVNNMFDIATSGLEITRMHPPVAIFILLIGLAALSGFLAGYSTAGEKSNNSLHIMCYVIITALTIYIIVDLEFPRVGLIRIDAFDQLLVNVRHDMD